MNYPTEYKNLKRRYQYFIIENKEENERLLCTKCKDILIEPYQTEDGCRFCKTCTNDKKSACHDKAIEKEIFALRMTCLNESCPVNCKLGTIDDHLKVCEYKRVKCTLCNMSFTYKEKREHESEMCEMRKTQCKDCGHEMRIKDLEEQHRNIMGDINTLCDKWIDICPYKCSEDIQYNIKTHLSTCETRPVECDMKNMGCTKILPRMNMNEHFQTELYHHMSLLMAEIDKLKLDNVKIKSESVETNKILCLEIDTLKREIDKSSTETRKLTEKLAVCENNYSKLMREACTIKESLRLNNQSPSKYGEYTWQIGNILDKINDAKSGINMQIFSEPFYTDNPGYKLCLKMYPNGDGQLRKNFISLYFVVMKGDYDDEISWPFNRKISLSLLSNKIGILHRTANMKPDNNASCYGKPRNTFNLGAGHPTFISHEELINGGEYINNDAISIHVRVLEGVLLDQYRIELPNIKQRTF